MSRERAMAALQGRATDRVVQLVTYAHPASIHHVTGIDPYEQTEAAWVKWVEKLDFDASILSRLAPPQVKDGELLETEHHTLGQWGLRDTPWLSKPYYNTIDEVLAFDPRNHDASSKQEKVDHFCADYEAAAALFGDNALYIPGQYSLVLHYMPFYCDWVVFMEALALEPDKCRFIFDRCMSYSIEVFEALAQTAAPVVIAHEDLCSARGPIFSSDLLRREVFPRFTQIYAPVKQAGKRVLAFGEGKIESIGQDLLDAGADGLFVDQNNDLQKMIDLVGPDGLLVAGGNTLTVTNGTPEEIRAEVQANMELAKKLPGFFFCLVGEAPNNLPLENLTAYFDACREFGVRQ